MRKPPEQRGRPLTMPPRWGIDDPESLMRMRAADQPGRHRRSPNFFSHLGFILSAKFLPYTASRATLGLEK